MRKQVVWCVEGRGLGLGLWLPDRLGLGLGEPASGVLEALALGEAERLGVADDERLPVIDRLLPMVLVALCPAAAPLEETAGSTRVAAPLASGPPPSSSTAPIMPTATTAAVAPPIMRVRFLRRCALWDDVPDRFARLGARRSRRRATGSAGEASRGSHTALIAGP